MAEGPLLIAETPNAGVLGHRYLIPTGAAVSELVAIHYVDQARGRDTKRGDDFLAVSSGVRQVKTGRENMPQTLVLANSAELQIVRTGADTAVCCWAAAEAAGIGVDGPAALVLRHRVTPEHRARLRRHVPRGVRTHDGLARTALQRLPASRRLLRVRPVRRCIGA